MSASTKTRKKAKASKKKPSEKAPKKAKKKAAGKSAKGSAKKASKKAGSKSPKKAAKTGSGKVGTSTKAKPIRKDPDLEIDQEVLEFIAALDAYKKKNNRLFPSNSEILQVLKDLGYRKVQD